MLCPSPLQSLKLWSDLRYLAVSAFLMPRPQAGQLSAARGLSAGVAAASAAAAIAGAAEQHAAGQQPLLFIVAAASDASLELLCADLASTPRQLGTGRRPEQFPAVARLCHHTCPVLSTAHCCLQLPGRRHCDGDSSSSSSSSSGSSSGGGSSGSSAAACHIAFSGATEGTVAAWDLTSAVGAASAVVSHSAAQQAQLELAPLLVLPSLHQSGVNCMAVVPAGEWCWPAALGMCRPVSCCCALHRPGKGIAS